MRLADGCEPVARLKNIENVHGWRIARRILFAESSEQTVGSRKGVIYAHRPEVLISRLVRCVGELSRAVGAVGRVGKRIRENIRRRVGREPNIRAGQNTIAHIPSGHIRYQRSAQPFAQALITAEEERFVLKDWPPQGSAELVPMKR